MKKFIKRLLLAIVIIIGIIALAFVILIGVLTVREYKPEATEELTINGEAGETLSVGDTLSVVTWNTGYGSLGSYADFFMDGGTQVNTSTEEQVVANIQAIADEIQALEADIVFLQEIDDDSTRSHHVDEVSYYSTALGSYAYSLAYNFRVDFIPYPIPPIGKVSSGVATYSSFEMESAVREALPNPFSYPVRIGNLKRCLLVSRVPIEGTDAELVLINLHLEAYDSGEGKIAQTKQLRELIESEVAAGNYVIAGGDFNQVFSNVDTSDYPILSDDYWTPGEIDVDEFEGVTFYTDNSAPTCRSLDKALDGNEDGAFQFYIIDGFIVSNNLVVNEVTTQDLGFKNSDHNPIYLNVTLQ